MDSEFEGWDKVCVSVSELKQHLDEETSLPYDNNIDLRHGCVFWRSNESEGQQQSRIITLLKATTSLPESYRHYIIQFWGVKEVEGRHHHLSSSKQPFYVGKNKSGTSQYRKLYRDHVYVVDMEGDDDEEHLSCIGRAYRSKQPLFSPDLRLFSTHEFPMRDDAARQCKGYMALPLFDLHTNQYYGVLEFVSYELLDTRHLLSQFDRALEIAGLRSTHTPISKQLYLHPWSEIKDIIKLAMAIVPILSLVQVWIPCKQCVNMSSKVCCMEIAEQITNQWPVANDGDDMSIYLDACNFHRLQIDVRSCQSNLCDVSISRNPLAHFSQRAILPHCFPISLQSVTDGYLYVLQFFLQPIVRKDAYTDYSPLLSRIVEMNLKTFKFLEDSQKPNAIDSVSIHSLNTLMSYKEEMSEWNFKEYLKMPDGSCCLRPLPAMFNNERWFFSLPTTDRFRGNDVKSNSLLIKKKIENFMKDIAVTYGNGRWIVQFWAPKMEKDICHLKASDQPFAVGCLAKGIASFREKCMAHYYLVDDKAKEEELGPPGRVFRNGHPEISPDVSRYTEKEFLIRNHAMHCLSRGYFALPIFADEHNHKCVGVLEFVGFNYYNVYIRKQMEVANLHSAHIDFHPRFLANEPRPVYTMNCRRNVLTEIQNAIPLIRKRIPQFHLANVWVPNGECFGTSSNMRCMELALTTKGFMIYIMPTVEVHQILVQIGKGMVGMVLSSESKSCFCRNLSEFSIVDQPLSHFEMSDRHNVCFAICLQSAHTGDIVYVLEFFLYQGPATCDYVRSFLNLLLPIMKNELKSFKMASGKQLGEELVVEVIEFSEADKLDSSESEQGDVFPIKFKSVLYGQKDLRQHTEEQHVEECNLPASEQGDVFPIKFKSVQYGQKDLQQHTKEPHVEERNLQASDSKKRDRGKGKRGLHLSLELLEPHFGKKLKDVAEELGVGRSTIKRACRDYGIDRWPSNEKHKRNLTLFGGESGGVSQQETNAESSHHANVQEEAEKMIIKVKHESDIIKFEFCLSLGLTKIIEEVATRLILDKGSFKMKYLDEDDDEILLTKDDDLRLCPKSQTATGKTCIQLLVRF